MVITFRLLRKQDADGVRGGLRLRRFAVFRLRATPLRRDKRA